MKISKNKLSEPNNHSPLPEPIMGVVPDEKPLQTYLSTLSNRILALTVRVTKLEKKS